MIDSEFERKGREMSDELNQIQPIPEVDLEYTWPSEPLPVPVCLQVASCNGAVILALEAALEFERQQVQDVAKVAEYYRALVQDARDERDAALTKLAEYEGENKRWHSFETVQAIVQEREQLRARIAELESERATLRLSLNTTNVIVNDQIGKIADLIKERDAAIADALRLVHIAKHVRIVSESENNLIEKYAK